jgi:SAM-dependent methyltransferase
MITDSHRSNWEEMSTLDPLWAILSTKEKRFGGWDLDEFLRTGIDEIAQIMDKAGELSLPLSRKRALDFGCGIGRLTRALQSYFDECCGVDISSEMLARAAALNPKCEFRINLDVNLHIFPDNHFDFVYSNLVLQHQPDREAIISYIGEMLRVLAPEGLLVFQLPCNMPLRNRIQGRRRLWSLLRALGVSADLLYNRLKLSPICMNWMPENETKRHISRFGGRALRSEAHQQPGEPFVSCVYYCSKENK